MLGFVMKVLRIIVFVIAAVSGAMIAYAFFAVEPDYAQYGSVGLACAAGLYIGAAGLRLAGGRAKQQIPCPGCGVINYRSNMVMRRCIPCWKARLKKCGAYLKKDAARFRQRREAQREWRRRYNEQKAVELREQRALQQAAFEARGRIAVCPRCGSPSIQLVKQGYSTGNGCLGAFVFGWWGLLFGQIGANKTHRQCLNCNHRW